MERLRSGLFRSLPRGRLGKPVAVLLAVLAAAPAGAPTFVVDTAADQADALPGDGLCQVAGGACSLRAAVQEANALPGPDQVELPAGRFELSIAGAGEDAAASGDLDVLDDLTLRGVAEELTVVDAAGLDRVLQVAAPGVTLRLETLTVRGGEVGHGVDGGCITNPEGGALDLERVTVRDCRCRAEGCAVFNGGLLEGTDVSILDSGQPDLSSAVGGGIANVGPHAQISLLRCELRGNQASNGGAVYTSAGFVTPQDSRVRLERCSLVGNQVLQLGGGVFLNSLTRVELLDSTVAGNEAGSGGGLFNDGGGVFEIRNSTIRENHATNIGGGIGEVHFDPDLILVSNSVIAGNTADFIGPDCHLALRSEGATLIGDSTDCQLAPGPGDLLDLDPLLEPLTELAPRLWVYIPGAGSPVVDAGSDTLCTETDQTGTSRPRDGDGDGEAHCDLGAVELAVVLFASGFETGDTGEWSEVAP